MQELIRYEVVVFPGMNFQYTQYLFYGCFNFLVSQACIVWEANTWEIKQQFVFHLGKFLLVSLVCQNNTPEQLLASSD